LKRVFIVDEDANGLASDLNGIARRDGLDFEFEPFVSPVQMFQELENGVPDLILLHHHWPGLAIASLLDRIGTVAEETRVISFHGSVR
jgi:DNA-binding NtrC family response regulator